MSTRRNFLKTAALGAAGLHGTVRALASRRQSSGCFTVHPFVDNHPEAVFIMPTRVDHKLNSQAKMDAGLDFARSVLLPGDENGIPLTASIPVKLNLKTVPVKEESPLEDVIGTVTDPWFSEGVFEGMKELGIPGRNIHVCENPRGDTFRQYGILDSFERIGVDFRTGSGNVARDMEPGRDFNWWEVPEGKFFTKIPILSPINEPDTWMLNISKFKTHGMGMTLCSKNIQGTVVPPFVRFCSPADSDMNIPLSCRHANAIEFIRTSHRHHLGGIPRWDRPGPRGGIWQEAWSHRTLDYHSVTPMGFNVIEAIYGRDGDCGYAGPHPFDIADVHGKSGTRTVDVAKDYMSNMVIFGKNIFRVDIVGHWLGGHEPGNFGYFHLAVERGLSNVLDPRNIPVYFWNNGEAVLQPLESFSRTPLLTYYLQRDYNGGIEPEYHLVDEPFDYRIIKGVDRPERPTKPDVFVLCQSFVTPENPHASIEYRLPISGFVRLEVRDSRGDLVDILVDDYRVGGAHMTRWNTRNRAPGTYSYRLRINGYRTSGGLVLMAT